MTRTLYDTAAAALVGYPRADDADVVGLDPRYLVLLVQQDPQPEYDPATERLDPTLEIDLDAAVVRRGWAVVTLPPPEPVPEWIAFYSALNADPTIGLAVEEVLRHLLPPSPAANLRALGGLYVGLGQAASDGDSRVFLQTWQLAAAGGLLSPEVIAGVQALAASFNLPAEFIAGLQPPSEEPPE